MAKNRTLDLLIIGAKPQDFTSAIKTLTRNYTSLNLYQIGEPNYGVNPDTQKLAFKNKYPITFGDYEDEAAIAMRMEEEEHPAVIVFTDDSEENTLCLKTARRIAAYSNAQYREVKADRVWKCNGL